LVRNGQIPDSIVLRDILTNEHDSIGVHWAILDEGSRWRPPLHLTTFYHRPILDGYEEFAKHPIASLTKRVVDPQFRGLCLSNIMAQVV
jgi:hypothetical protein